MEFFYPAIPRSLVRKVGASDGENRLAAAGLEHGHRRHPTPTDGVRNVRQNFGGPGGQREQAGNNDLDERHGDWSKIVSWTRPVLRATRRPLPGRVTVGSLHLCRRTLTSVQQATSQGILPVPAFSATSSESRRSDSCLMDWNNRSFSSGGMAMSSVIFCRCTACSR